MRTNGLEFGGEETFAASREHTFAALTDLNVLTLTLPDVESCEQIAPHAVRCVVRPGFSFLRGKLTLEIELGPVTPPERAMLRVHAKGIGATIRAESTLRLEPIDDAHTLLRWEAVVTELKGLVATVGKSLIRAAAEQVITLTWPKLREQVERK